MLPFLVKDKLTVNRVSAPTRRGLVKRLRYAPWLCRSHLTLDIDDIPPQQASSIPRFVTIEGAYTDYTSSEIKET